jgi:hypothetical protein
VLRQTIEELPGGERTLPTQAASGQYRAYFRTARASCAAYPARRARRDRARPARAARSVTVPARPGQPRTARYRWVQHAPRRWQTGKPHRGEFGNSTREKVPSFFLRVAVMSWPGCRCDCSWLWLVVVAWVTGGEGKEGSRRTRCGRIRTMLWSPGQTVRLRPRIWSCRCRWDSGASWVVFIAVWSILALLWDRDTEGVP